MIPDFKTKHNIYIKVVKSSIKFDAPHENIDKLSNITYKLIKLVAMLFSIFGSQVLDLRINQQNQMHIMI